MVPNMKVTGNLEGKMGLEFTLTKKVKQKRDSGLMEKEKNERDL